MFSVAEIILKLFQLILIHVLVRFNMQDNGN